MQTQDQKVIDALRLQIMMEEKEKRRVYNRDRNRKNGYASQKKYRETHKEQVQAYQKEYYLRRKAKKEEEELAKLQDDDQ